MVPRVVVQRDQRIVPGAAAMKHPPSSLCARANDTGIVPVPEWGHAARMPPARDRAPFIIIIIALVSSNTIQDTTPGQGYLIVRSSIKSVSH